MSIEKLKLSPWHDKAIKPVHIGLYKVRGMRIEGWAYWHGNYWGWVCVRKLAEAYHWPTISHILAAEIERLRALIDVAESKPATPLSHAFQQINSDCDRQHCHRI